MVSSGSFYRQPSRSARCGRRRAGKSGFIAIAAAGLLQRHSAASLRSAMPPRSSPRSTAISRCSILGDVSSGQIGIAPRRLSSCRARAASIVFRPFTARARTASAHPTFEWSVDVRCGGARPPCRSDQVDAEKGTGAGAGKFVRQNAPRQLRGASSCSFGNTCAVVRRAARRAPGMPRPTFDL